MPRSRASEEQRENAGTGRRGIGYYLQRARNLTYSDTVQKLSVASGATHAELSRYLRPGRLPFYVLGLCIAFACLDILNWLPHPMGEFPGSLSKAKLSQLYNKTEEHLTGITQHEIRNRYHIWLEAWGVEATKYLNMIERGELTLLEEKLPLRSCSNCSNSPVCRLAEASIKERYAARVNCRRYGTAVVHLFLMVRDRFMHGSGYYDVQGFFRSQMAKMKKERAANVKACTSYCATTGCSWTRSWSCPWAAGDGNRGRAGNDGTRGYSCCCQLRTNESEVCGGPQAELTEEDVCSKVVASSVKSNALYNNLVKLRASLHYVFEAFGDWTKLTLSILLLGWVLEKLFARITRRLHTE